MKFNFRGLAFKQSIWILIGVTIAFATTFAVLSSQMRQGVYNLVVQKGEEISEANVTFIDKLFNTGRKIGDDIAESLGKQEMTRAEMDGFLLQSLSNARKILPQVIAVVVAYEPGMGPETDSGEFMRLARYVNDETVLISGANYQDKEWYASTRKGGTSRWQEPFIGDFVPEPIAVYTIPIVRKNKQGEDVLVGVLAVDMSIDFLKNTIASIPVSDSGYAMILSAKNSIVAHPKSIDLGASNNALVEEKIKTEKGVNFDRVAQKSQHGLFRGFVGNGDLSAIYYTTIKSNNWVFMVVWPMQKFLKDQAAFVKHIGLFVLGGYVLILIFVLLISYRISHPLRQLAKAVEKFGSGNFDAELPVVKGHDEIALLASAFSGMQASIKENIKTQKSLGRIERELDFARNIQLAMLPDNEVEENCNDDRHELAPFMLPAKEVGGDFYDFFKIDNDHLCIVVGDVSGKGVPASLFMMVSRIILRTMMKNLKSVEKTFNSTNFALAKRNKLNMFVTVWMGVIDLRTGLVEFASAGHNPPVIRHADGSVEFVKSKSGLVMAAMENVRYHMQTCELLPGDTIFLYTDGVTEATNSKDELFGDARLLETIAKSKDIATADICKFVKKEIDLFVDGAPQFDDITMMGVKYIGSDEPVWERYEKTIDVGIEGQGELKTFVEGILSPMDGLAKVQMQNAWERYEKIVDVIPENQDILTAFVEGILAPMEGSVKSQMQINIAIDEIYSNIVKFSGATRVTLIVEVRKATLTAKLTFIDNGAPYDPLKSKDPDITLSAEEREVGGLGIFIVKKTMDSVCYRRNGENNELAITKTL